MSSSVQAKCASRTGAVASRPRCVRVQASKGACGTSPSRSLPAELLCSAMAATPIGLDACRWGCSCADCPLPPFRPPITLGPSHAANYAGAAAAAAAMVLVASPAYAGVVLTQPVLKKVRVRGAASSGRSSAPQAFLQRIRGQIEDWSRDRCSMGSRMARLQGPAGYIIDVIGIGPHLDLGATSSIPPKRRPLAGVHLR
jgi:hypothetical protein